MSSPGQRRGGCGHAMANFDTHAFCARCREKGKGTDDCTKNPQSANCSICNAFSEDQRIQLATPSYRIKKEKREAKKLESTPVKDTEALVDPTSVSVIGPIDKPTPAKPALEAQPPNKKIKKDTKKVGKKDNSPSSTVSKPPSADDKIADLDSKWAERFNRIEALLLSKSFEPQFSASVKVTPTHSPPASVERVSDPFIQPLSSSAALPGTGKALTSQQSSSSKFPGTGSSAHKHQPASQTKTSRPTSSTTNQPTPAGDIGTDLTPLSQQGSHRPTTDDSGSPALHRSRQDSFSSISSNNGSALSDRPPLDLYADEGEWSEEHSVTEQDQPIFEEQTYRDTMQGIRSYMGWTHIPEVDNTTATSDNNPFAGPKTVTPGKVSVRMPTEEWLCKKLGKLNLTIAEGYPSRGSEAGGLAKDVFIRPPRSQTKWYGLHTDQKPEPSRISSWHTDAVRLNSSYSRIARYTGLGSTPPASRKISQETLRRWERSAREASVVCNQTASFNRCLVKVQQNMKEQLRVLKALNKGKGSAKVSPAIDELHYLLDFNASISQAAAKSMEHLSDFVFITMGNLTLVRCDAYLSHLRTGIKQDTLTALRTAPLHLSTLFPDATIKRAEEDIAQFESKGHSTSGHGKGRYHPYERPERKSTHTDSRPDKPAWKTIGKRQYRKGKGRAASFSSRPAKGQQSYK